MQRVLDHYEFLVVYHRALATLPPLRHRMFNGSSSGGGRSSVRQKETSVAIIRARKVIAMRQLSGLRRCA